MEFNLLGDLLGLTADINTNPIAVASKMGCKFESDPELFRQLAEMSQVINGQIPFTPHNLDDHKKKRNRTQFSFEDQLIMYKEFQRCQTLDNQVIRRVCKQINKPSSEVKQWWYNRRSDVRDGKFKIPEAIQKILPK